MASAAKLICAGCNSAFERPLSQAGRKDRLGQKPYCSHLCRRTRVERDCEQCGQRFTAKPSDITHRGARWCSRACANPGRRRGQMFICKACGSPFYRFPCYVGKPGRTNDFCSSKCKGQRIREVMTGRPKTVATCAKISAAKLGVPNPLCRKPPILLSCTGCLRMFVVPGSQTARASVARFCGTTCWYSYIRTHAEEHPGFRGGFPPYYGPNWSHQARLARERDGNICQDCGLRQERPRLDVHHLVPRRTFGSDHQTANDLANLVTLCKACHTTREVAITKTGRHQLIGGH